MNTHSAQTLNTPSFKIYAALPYLLVIALSSILCFGFCKFAIDKEVENDISVTALISESMMMAENLIDKNLQCATEALNVYMQYNQVPKNQNSLVELAHKSGVDGFNIFNNVGKRIYASNGGCPYVNIAGCKWRITEAKPFLKNIMVNKSMEHSDAPIVFDRDVTMQGKVVGGYKLDIMYMPSKDILLDSYVGVTQIGALMKKSISRFASIRNMTLSTPSGVILIDTCNLNGTCNISKNDIEIGEFPKNDVYFDEYNESAVVGGDLVNIKISLPFGGLQDADEYKKDGTNQYVSGQTNDAGQYFYVMNVTFDKTELNKQLAIIIAGFIAFTLLACIAVYYINAYIAKSLELTDLSERMSDKVTHLCNTRLGEVRRYVTKIVKDSMRVDNMNKELPEEMVQLLDRAFREVDEKGLISEKKEDVQ